MLNRTQPLGNGFSQTILSLKLGDHSFLKAPEGHTDLALTYPERGVIIAHVYQSPNLQSSQSWLFAHKRFPSTHINLCDLAQDPPRVPKFVFAHFVFPSSVLEFPFWHSDLRNILC